MNKLNKTQKVLIWILTGFFIMTIFLASFKRDVFNNINDGVFNVVTSLRYTLFQAPINSANDKLKEVLDLQTITDENKLLRENVKALAANQAYIDSLEKENQALKELMKFKDTNEGLNFIAATVTFRNPESWSNTVKLDVGTNDGVKLNDAVILAEGLIGRIESVEEESSVVRLLISPEMASKVAVKINLEDDSSVEAIIDNYDDNSGAFNLSLLEANEDIQLGDQVVTTGSGGLIPAGIIVGEISFVEQSINQLGSKIHVKPYANFTSFEYVYVVSGS